MRVILKSSGTAAIRKAKGDLDHCLSVLYVRRLHYVAVFSLALSFALSLWLHLDSINSRRMAQIQRQDNQNLETDLEVAMKRHHGEELQLIQRNLTSRVSL